MARNEFGVESNSGGGFGADAGSDFESMFEEAANASVVDDDETVDGGYNDDFLSGESPQTREESHVEPKTEPEPVNEPVDDTDFNDLASFGSFSTPDTEVRFEQSEPETQAPEASENFATEEQPAEVEETDNSFYSNDTAIEESNYETEPEETHYEPEPVAPPAPRRSIPAAPQRKSKPVPMPRQQEVIRTREPEPVVTTDSDIDYIEQVILTSDAIRELSDTDAKAVNMFITHGQPVETHQELVLTALLADRQILTTAQAILEAKAKSSVDRAFHILGLDDETFVDFGRILSHDLEATETVLFEGDRLRYARKLVDIVEDLPEVSIQRFEAVQSVLGAGELED